MILFQLHYTTQKNALLQDTLRQCGDVGEGFAFNKFILCAQREKCTKKKKERARKWENNFRVVCVGILMSIYLPGRGVWVRETHVSRALRIPAYLREIKALPPIRSSNSPTRQSHKGGFNFLALFWRRFRACIGGQSYDPYFVSAPMRYHGRNWIFPSTLIRYPRKIRRLYDGEPEWEQFRAFTRVVSRSCEWHYQRVVVVRLTAIYYQVSKLHVLRIVIILDFPFLLTILKNNVLVIIRYVAYK